MHRPVRALGLMGLFVMTASRLVWALDTDQFTVPPQPLEDLGPHFSQKVRCGVAAAIYKVNARYRRHCRLAGTLPPGRERELHLQRAMWLQSELAVADAVFDELGIRAGKIDDWLLEDPRPSAIFRVHLRESIYRSSFPVRPLLLYPLAPTLNLYGTYLGTDKLDHFFRYGHRDYRRLQEAVAAGQNERLSHERVVQLAQRREKTGTGWWATGCYSNADLAADFAGSKFYANLTRPVFLGCLELPPIVVWQGDRWVLNSCDGGDFIRPFISDHLNESMNPNWYVPAMRPLVRSEIRKRRGAWLAFHGSSLERERQRLRELSTWYGEDYGHSCLQCVTTFFGTGAPASGGTEAHHHPLGQLDGSPAPDGPTQTDQVPPSAPEGRWPPAATGDFCRPAPGGFFDGIKLGGEGGLERRSGMAPAFLLSGR